jgi:predicted nuclease of predicted toxin-antitoxin system
MSDPALRILLDQNVPVAVAAWLKTQRPEWDIHHVNDLGFEGKPDDFLFRWARENHAVVVTFDEDFGDARMYPLGRHHGIVRLRIWPTTIEQTQRALSRLLASLPASDWRSNLIIIDNEKIRVRRL